MSSDHAREGNLGRTPFAHLLVYAMDRRLSGALHLKSPGGLTHTIRFDGGVPVKVKPSDGYARLGGLLVEVGSITEKTLADALSTRGLLGDVLILAGCIERDDLESFAELQFTRRMIRCFALPPETSFEFVNGSELLRDFGGGDADVNPMFLLWAGLREHGDKSSRIEPILETLRMNQLTLHPATRLERFGFGDDETLVTSHIKARPSSFDDIQAFEVVEPSLLRRLVYLLLITRAIDFGSGALPLGATHNARRPVVRSGVVFARIGLDSTRQRQGAAAPDAPGEGERPPTSSARTRTLTNQRAVDARREDDE